MISKKHIQGLLLIFLILVAVCIAFLLFFNPAIKAELELKNNMVEIKVENTQNHISPLFITLNDIIIKEFTLQPREKQTFEIMLKSSENNIEVRNEAQVFLSKDISLKDVDNTNALSFNISYKEMKLDTTNEIILNICNPNKDISLTTEIYENANFTLNEKEKTKIVEQDTCNDFSFVIIPTQSGSNLLTFHIFNVSNNINEEVGFNIIVN